MSNVVNVPPTPHKQVHLEVPLAKDTTGLNYSSARRSGHMPDQREEMYIEEDSQDGGNFETPTNFNAVGDENYYSESDFQPPNESEKELCPLPRSTPSARNRNFERMTHDKTKSKKNASGRQSQKRKNKKQHHRNPSFEKIRRKKHKDDHSYSSVDNSSNHLRGETQHQDDFEILDELIGDEVPEIRYEPLFPMKGGDKEDTWKQTTPGSSTNTTSVEESDWSDDSTQRTDRSVKNNDGGSGEFCFMCENGEMGSGSSQNPWYCGMQQLIERGSRMPLGSLCNLVQRYYNENLRRYEKSQRCWTITSIEKHLTEHGGLPADACIDIMMRMQFAIIYRLSKNELVMIEPTSGRRSMDIGALASMSKLMQQYLALDRGRRLTSS
jgi:hypothetical protein